MNDFIIKLLDLKEKDLDFIESSDSNMIMSQCIKIDNVPTCWDIIK